MFMDLDNMLSAWKNVKNGLKWKLYLGLLLNVTFIVSLDGATRELIIGRGRYKIKDTAQQYADNFTYTDNSICLINNQVKVWDWCKTKNADSSTTAKHGQCSCQCHYLLSAPIDLDGGGTMDTTKSCDGCKIKSIMYYFDSKWNDISKCGWKIEKNGSLKWPPVNINQAKGKILKIQLKNCKLKSNKSTCSWGSRALKIFIKSKGNYSINLDASVSTPSSSPLLPTPSLTGISAMTSSLQDTSMTSQISLRVPTTSVFMGSQYVCSDSINCQSSTDTVNVGPITIPSSMLSPTPALITSKNLMTSPSEQGNTCTRYTSTRTEITQQVSTATVIFVSPAWDSVSSEIFPKSTSAVIQYSTTSKPGNDNALGAEDPSSVGAIVGSIVPCIVLMAVVFCLVWKRCKVNSRGSSSATTKGPPDSTDNPMYGKNQGEVIALPHRQGKDGLSAGVEEYDYAAVDGDGSKNHSVQSKPIYQSLIKDNVQDSVYTSLNKETPPKYSYNHLQHPTYNPPRSKDVPSELLYNKLQKPNDDDYLEPGLTINDNQNGTSEEPVYNVLEDSNANLDPQDSETVYNVLEDPNSNLVPSQEPLYNVLEDPDDNYDNAPVDDQNHAASGQDNIAYSSNIDLVIPPSPDYDVLEGPEGTLSDPTYQPLSMRTQDDVYQPLDRASQPVYQTLEPNESTV